MGIHAVEMVRHIRDEHYNLLKNMTYEEHKEFYHQRAKIVNSRVTILMEENRKKNDNKKSGQGV